MPQPGAYVKMVNAADQIGGSPLAAVVSFAPLWGPPVLGALLFGKRGAVGGGAIGVAWALWLKTR